MLQIFCDEPYAYWNGDLEPDFNADAEVKLHLEDTYVRIRRKG